MTAGYVPLATSPAGAVSAVADDRYAPEVDEAAVVVPGEDSVTPFVWGLVGAAAISGLLFGCVLHSIPFPTRLPSVLTAATTQASSAVLCKLTASITTADNSVVIGTDLGTELTTHQKEEITSATTLGALIGGLGAGTLSDARGRKGVLFLANIVFIVGALLQSAAHTVPTMVVGRFVVGLGVGLASCIAPLYIGELAPTRMRGRLVTVNAVVCTFGQVVAYGWPQME